VLGMSLVSAQKCPDIDICRLTARWDIGLVPHEHVPGSWIAAKGPPISVRAAVKLSFLDGHPSPLHARVFARLDQYYISIGCLLLGLVSLLRQLDCPLPEIARITSSSPTGPTPERCVGAYYLQRTRFESMVERKLRRRQLT
jgi:hypothetical protein